MARPRSKREAQIRVGVECALGMYGNSRDNTGITFLEIDGLVLLTHVDPTSAPEGARE